TVPFPNATPTEKAEQAKQTGQARSAAKTAEPTEPKPAATGAERPAAERSTTTAAAAAATKPEPAGSEGSAAGPKSAVPRQIGERQRPKGTTAKRPISSKERTAKETAATARRKSISLAGLGKTAE